MDTIVSIAKRRMSCRNFADDMPSKETLTGLINDAVWVPSGSNGQPWRFAVIMGREKLKSYSDMAKTMWLETIDRHPHMQPYIDTFKDPKANIFYNAPAAIIVYGNSDSYWYLYDCSMVAGNLHLLAEEAGLGCCWIGEAHNVFDEPSVKKELDVPEKYRLVAPLIIGVPAQKKNITESLNKRKAFEISFK